MEGHEVLLVYVRKAMSFC